MRFSNLNGDMCHLYPLYGSTYVNDPMLESEQGLEAIL